MDLNIENYTYSDLLNVFKISNNNSLENIEIVVRRKELWKYLEELKNDKILKRFILPI